LYTASKVPPRDTEEPETAKGNTTGAGGKTANNVNVTAEANTTGKTSNNVNVTAKKYYTTISESFVTFVKKGKKRKNDNQPEMEANKSTSVPLKKAKTDKSSSSIAPRQKRAPAATPSASKGSKKRANPTDDESAAPDGPKTPVPPMKKKRSNKGDIVNKLQPVRRSGIALCI
jgi:hypothetical protein